MAKVDYLHTNKDCNEARDELVMLCNELESRKAGFFVVESVVGYRKNYEAKLFEQSMQEGGNRVLDIIWICHPKWIMDFQRFLKRTSVLPRPSGVPLLAFGASTISSVSINAKIPSFKVSVI